MRGISRIMLGGVLVVLLSGHGFGAPPGPTSASWPQFHGPKRDNKSLETGLLKEWPSEGPKLLWTARGIGSGFATVAIADGFICTAGNIKDRTVVTALDPDGKIQWQADAGPPWRQTHLSGSRGCPTVDGNRVYYESPHGQVVCLEAKTGKTIWLLNLFQKFGGQNINWALAEGLLIDRDRLICCPGAPGAGVVALDKYSGKTVWVCKETQDQAGYASPILVNYQGLPQVITMTAKAAIGVHADTGALLWRFEHTTPFDENILMPIYHDGHVFIDSGHKSGGELLKLKVSGNSCTVEVAWRTKALDNQHGGILLLDGYLYGASHKSNPGRWICLDFQTGQPAYIADSIGKGSLTYADGMLYLFNESGTVALVPATPKGHIVVGRFDIPRGGTGPTWAHPVVCGGRLYLRHADYLFAYDLRKKG